MANEKAKPSGQNRTLNRGKKLLFFLSRFSHEELAGFSEWLQSPLHTNSPQLHDMLSLLLREMESSDAPQISSEMFAALLSPDRPMDAQKIAYTWSRLAHLQRALFDYLAWLQSKNDPDLQGQWLLEAMCDRGWEKYILPTYESAAKNLGKSRKSRQMQKKLNLESTLSHYLASHGKAGQDKHMNQIHQALDGLYLLGKLKYACAGLLDGHPESDPEQSEMLAAVLHASAKNSESLPRVTEVYLNAYLMLRAAMRRDPESEAFFSKFSSLYEGLVGFSPDEAVDLFTHGQNYCILRYRTGASGFVDALQRLYQLILESGMILQKGMMPLQFYKNAVELMCRFRRFAWSEDFVEKYQDQIAHDPEKHVYHYNLGVIRFFQGRYPEVVKLLYNRLGALDRMQAGTGGRVYFCQALWETGEEMWLLSVLNAFEQYLRRSKGLTAAQKSGYGGFVNYLRQACLAVTGDPGKQEGALQRLLEEMKQKESKDKYVWIREKVEAALAADPPTST
jgi:hypothetical protein